MENVPGPPVLLCYMGISAVEAFIMNMFDCMNSDLKI